MVHLTTSNRLTKFHFYFLFHCQDLQCKKKDRKKKFTIMFALESSWRWPSFIVLHHGWNFSFLLRRSQKNFLHCVCAFWAFWAFFVGQLHQLSLFWKMFFFISLWHYVEDFVRTIEIYNSISPFSIVWLQLTLSVGNYLMSSCELKKMFWLSGTRVFLVISSSEVKNELLSHNMCVSGNKLKLPLMRLLRIKKICSTSEKSICCSFYFHFIVSQSQLFTHKTFQHKKFWLLRMNRINQNVG